MIVHFLWIGNKVITYIWWAQTCCLFLLLLWAILFTSCETSPRRISKYLREKLKQRNRGLEGTPCVLEPSPPLAPGHITQCLSSAVLTLSYKPSVPPNLHWKSALSSADCSTGYIMSFSFQLKYIHGQFMPICSCANTVLYLQKIFSFLDV